MRGIVARQIEARAGVDSRHDPPAQVESAGDLRRDQRDAGDALGSQHILDFQHGHPEHLAADLDGEVIAGAAGFAGGGSDCLCLLHHACPCTCAAGSRNERLRALSNASRSPFWM